MMVFRNSIKNVIRSKGKSILFFLLIASITVVLCLGISVWVSINQFLDECNDSYTTIGVIEYMGPGYPDDYVYDSRMNEAIAGFDFSIIKNNENVITWEPSAKALGYIDGFVRKDVYAPFRTHGVIRVSDKGEWNYYKTDSIVIKDTIYSSIDYTNKLVLVEPFDYEFEDGHTYLVNGSYVFGKTSYPYFRPEAFVSKTAAEDGYSDSQNYIIDDITDMENGYIVDPDSVFLKIADTYKVINNSLTVFATQNIEAMFPFHQQKIYVQEGRLFTEEEYASGDKVCIISDFIAKSCNLAVGDNVTVSFAIKEDTPFNESYWGGTGFEHEGIYKVVGITNSIPETISYVYIPKDETLDFTVNQIGFTLGHVHLDNDGADDFYHSISEQLPDRMRLTVYDQGYSTVVEPFKKILRIAVIITLSCLLVGLAVIVLFGYLFVYRQRESADTMMKLGTGRARTFFYFIVGSGVISLLASAVGMIVGMVLSDTVVRLVHENAENFVVTDKRYSIARLSIEKVTEWITGLDPMVFIWTGLGIFIFAVMCCLVFTVFTLRNKNKEPRKKKVRKRKGHSMSFTGGPLKYSVISILRGRQRSIITPVVVIAIIIFLSQLAHTVDRYHNQLEYMYDNSVIDCQFTDINGRYFDNLSVEAYLLSDMNQSGLLDNLSVSKFMIYKYLGIAKSGTEEFEVPHLIFPSGFPGETFVDKILRGPNIVFTNSITNAPEFYFGGEVDTRYYKGYDESFLGWDKGEIPLCMVSTEFMEQNDVKLGDVIRIYIHTRKKIEYPYHYDYKRNGYELDLRVMGSYVKAGEKDNIYCQLSAYYDDRLLEDDTEEGREDNFEFVMDSANFTINGTDLAEFKAFAHEYGLSEARHAKMVRSYIICDDKSFNSTVDSLNQKIMHTRTLYPFLYVLVGIVALLLAYLLAVSRKKEIALMMGMGAPRIRIFMSFFLEQVILAILGCAAGLGAWRIFAGALIDSQLILAGGFLLCYFIGNTVALMIMNGSVVMSILKEEE